MVTALVSPAKPAPGRVTSLATTRSAFFFSSFLRAFSATFCVSAAKATRICPSRLRAPSSAAMSVVFSSSNVMPSPLFLIFSAATARGRKSAGAAAWMTTSLPSARESTASHSSAQETMGTNSTPAGAGRETGPETSVTVAPRSRAASAMAKPILPVERLVRKRTGSSISRVGPAVMSRRRPAKSCLGQRTSSMACRMAAGSSMRPTSSSPQARWPRAGPQKRAPHARRHSTFFCVAGCLHMAAFIAGASSTGQRMAR